MNKLRIAFRVVCAVVLLLAIVEVAWVRPARSADDAHHAPAAAGNTENRVEALVRELEERKTALEERARTLDAREDRLKEIEKSIDSKLKEMEQLRAAVSGELEAQKKNNEERVLKMVQVFESMSPKSAAGVLETLDDWLSVEVLKRMDVKRVAKLMNQMDKNRSAKLSELLTGYYRPEAGRSLSGKAVPAGQAQASQTPAATPGSNPKKKGGE